MKIIWSWLFLAAAILVCQLCTAADDQANRDAADPLFLFTAEENPLGAPAALPAAGDFFRNASLMLRSSFYGRARSADNRNRGGGHGGEIHVNAFGQAAEFRSGYAWGVLGADFTGQANLGRGRGTSEVLRHWEPGNRDGCSLSLGQAALKSRFGSEETYWEARGGYTPLSVGTLGTSGGLHSHSYRGFETKVHRGNLWLGYARADRFSNEWDTRHRKMTAAWHQNRWGYNGGRRIPYIHSLGARAGFGFDGSGFADAGIGEGRGYRRNAHIAAAVPFDLGAWGKLTLTGYGFTARYGKHFRRENRRQEYHVSGMARLDRGDWTFSAGMGHTRAPDSEEMQFRLTAWGNSDNRNFIQTWAQLDDFVWDGQNAVKAGAVWRFGRLLGLPGLSAGADFVFSWNGRNPGTSRTSAGSEIDYRAEYEITAGRFKGLAFGIYAAHLRYAGNGFHGKQNRNDIKAAVVYSVTLENFLRRSSR